MGCRRINVNCNLITTLFQLCFYRLNEVFKFTFFRKDGYGEKDIYEIYNDFLGVRDVAVLKGVIKTVDDKPIPEDFAINVKMVCVDCDNDEQKYVYTRMRDGIFMTALKPCKTYKLEYMKRY